jgi:pimeloyl-ACP methyl ester carboxylesterase
MQMETIRFSLKGAEVTIEALVQTGKKPAILFLHGFGSAKGEYEKVPDSPVLSDRAIIAYDAPGHGGSLCSKPSLVTIDFLRQVGTRVAAHFYLEKFHLAGHSMGGLTALKMLPSFGDRVLSFINIEGNLAPEDCFLSRQILEYPDLPPGWFMEKLAQSQKEANLPGHDVYAARLRKNVTPEVVAPIFQSMVETTDSENLLDQFIQAPLPKLFVYGEENRNLSYLAILRKNRVSLEEIPNAAHFPMYSNPKALWRTIAGFIERVEGKLHA